MKRSSIFERLQAATAAIAVIAVMALPFAQATAADDEESPFGDAVKVADASLDTMRGGFEPPSGGLLRFAVNVTTAVNGTPVAALSIDNLKGSIEFSSTNLGHAVTIPANASAGGSNFTSITSTGTQVQTVPHGPTLPAPPPVTTPVNITTTLVPAPSGTITGNGTITSAPVATSFARAGSLDITSHAGQVLAMTQLLPDGRGLLTLVQNVNSNTAIHLQTALGISVSGLGNTLTRNGVTARAFANSMNMSLRH